MGGCPTCEGRGFRVGEGCYEICECLIAKKAKAYIQPLKPISLGDEDRGTLNALTEAGFHNGPIHLTFSDIPQAKINGILAALLLANSPLPSYLALNVYELLEIYLGNDPRFSSVLHLKMDRLILMRGYNEFENKRQMDIILQTHDNRRRYGKLTWYVKVGLPDSLPQLIQYLKTEGYEAFVIHPKGVQKGW